MPGVFRYTIDNLGTIVDNVIQNKIPMIALFHQHQITRKTNMEMRL